MAVHTGRADLRAGDYYGVEVNRCARLRSLAHGGQIVVSDITAGFCDPDRDLSLEDLGTHRLKDLSRPVRVFQVRADGIDETFPPLRSVDVFANNIPVQLTPFVGRELELGEVSKLLASRRGVTLVGPGGAGKTRLALQVAAEELESFGGGTWFVDLTKIEDPDLVAATVAGAIGINEQPGASFADSVVAYLASSDALVILDNCEHVLEGVRQLADRLLRECVELTVLCTSRERIGLTGESTYVVPPMQLPSSDDTAFIEALVDADAVRLFVERAEMVRSDFALDPENAPHVVEICRRLDGLPLAIELVAARTRVMSPRDIAARIEGRLSLLRGGPGTDERHRTMRAAIDTSYEGLDATQQELFAGLSVFVGGFTVEGAESVTGTDVFEGIEAFVDRSLLAVEEDAEGRTRYRMLETIREYARERLEASERRDAVVASFIGWCEDHASTVSSTLHTEDFAEAIRGIDIEHANLVAGLSVARVEEPGRAVAIARHLWMYWHARGRFREGRYHLEHVASLDGGDPCKRMMLRYAVGILAMNMGDLEAGSAWLGEGLEMARRAGDEAAIGVFHNGLGTLARITGDLVTAERHLREALVIARRSDDDRKVLSPLVNLGNICLHTDLDEARSLYEEALATARRIGDLHMTAQVLGNLSLIAILQVDLESASALYREGIDLAESIGMKGTMARAFVNGGIVARLRGDTDESIILTRRGAAIKHEIDDVHGHADATVALATALVLHGAIAEARNLLDDVLASMPEGGPPVILRFALLARGDIARIEGDLGRAREILERAVEVDEEIGDKPDPGASQTLLAAVERTEGELDAAGRLLLVALERPSATLPLIICLDEVARFLAVRGDLEAAGELLGAIDAERERTGFVRLFAPGDLDADVDAEIRSAAGDALRAGRSLSLTDALALAQKAL